MSDTPIKLQTASKWPGSCYQAIHFLKGVQTKRTHENVDRMQDAFCRINFFRAIHGFDYKNSKTSILLY